MTSVLQMQKVLQMEPAVTPSHLVPIRTFRGEEDITPWVALREWAFGNERISLRSWHYTNFKEEFLSKSWWRPENLWLAEDEGHIVGSVTLARRGSGKGSQPAVHWLMVHPAHRRRGIATALMSHLEKAVWDAGERQIVLETHESWRRATAFYLGSGYQVV